MRLHYIELLHCTTCNSELKIEKVIKQTNERIEQGILKCKNETCNNEFAINNFVPRFVNHGKYAESFGEQWKTFAKTQLDTDKSKDSEIRWDSEIGWNTEELKDKTVIEFGSGAGRFVDIVSKRNPKLIIGIDITDAVDASQNNLGERDNVFFIQADFFNLPLKKDSFNFAYSIGVLHHTPNPEEAFQKMVQMVNRTGQIGVSLYESSLYKRPNRNSLYVSTIELFWAINMWRCEFFRQIVVRIPDKLFLAYCKTVVPFLYHLNKIPVLGFLRYLLPSTCYKNKPVEWSMVDTNDTYSTKIVHMYRHKDVFQWFLKVNLFNIIVHNSRAGWVCLTGTKEKNINLDYGRFIHEQPLAPGLEIK